jgi:hypothetical protein
MSARAIVWLLTLLGNEVVGQRMKLNAGGGGEGAA